LTCLPAFCGHFISVVLCHLIPAVTTKPDKNWWGILDDSYFGSFFIGAHAKAGTLHGFLDHTQSSESRYNYIVNVRKMGELGQWAMVCGHFNVPLIMVSGDEAAVNEATQFFGDIETAVVKKGISRDTARCIPNGEAEERIRKAAKAAVEKTELNKPFRPLLPMEIRFEFTRADYCDYSDNKPGMERIDARTLRKISNSHMDFWL
jgi:D-amino peptidase